MSIYRRLISAAEPLSRSGERVVLFGSARDYVGERNRRLLHLPGSGRSHPQRSEVRASFYALSPHTLSSRLFVGETCYLLWQCLDAVGPRAKLSHKLPLQAIASRIVQGELDPELRSLATFGNYFLSFQYAEAAPMVLTTEADDSEAREQRERERSEGGYSSR